MSSETQGQVELPPLPREITLEEVEKAMREELARGHAGQYRLGQLYNQVVQHGLAELGGYNSANDFFNQRVREISQSTLSLYGAMAKRFSEPVCVAHGMYKLEMLVRYAEKTGLETLPEDPGPMPLPMAPDRKGKVEQRAFSDCSVKDLKAALKALKAPPPKSEHSVEDKAKHRRLAVVLDQKFPQKDVQARLVSHKGRTCLDLSRVPLDEWPRLFEAMREALGTPPMAH